jgi:integrase
MARKAKQVAGVYEREPGSGLWYARYFVDGKKVRKSFGRDRQAAVDYLEKTRVLKRSGEGVVPKTAKKPVLTSAEVAMHERHGDGVTVAQLCDALLSHIVERHRMNPNKYKDQANPPRRLAVIKKAFGDRRADGLKPYEIQDWYTSLKCGPATQNRYRGMVSQVFSFGRRNGWLTANPVRDSEKQPTSSGVIRWMTGEEEARIRKVLTDAVEVCGPNQPTLRQRAIHRMCEFDVALNAGMRRGEQYLLTWDQVDLEQRVLILENTKALNARRVYLNKSAYEAFLKLAEMSLRRKVRRVGERNHSPADIVFAKGDPKKWWASTTHMANVHNLRWHDLRHTFCSRLTQRSVNLKVIQELAGHKSIATTARYAHADDAAKRRAVAILEAAEPADAP